LATLQAAWGTTVTCVFLQEKGTSVSATNPLYTVSLLVNNTTDINGAVGDIGMQSITFTANSAIVVATTGTF
jgi:glycerol uptake facilitator-like aquaporin